MRPTLRGAGLGAILAAAVASPALAWAPAAAPVAPGCGTGPAVAHYSGGAPVTPAPGGGPVPCGVSTGFAGAESHIVATAHAVVFMPAVQPSGLVGTGTAPVPIDDHTQSNADPAGLAVTSDHGGAWALVKPFGLTWNPTDHGDYVDPATGRLFFEDYGPIPLAPVLGPAQEGPAHVMWTNDPTSSAGWHHTALPAMFLPENPRFEAAPPPAGAQAPSGYPDVVYFCANTNVGFVSPVITGRVCYRSLDGGDSFTPGAVLFTGAVPQHPECGGSGEIYSAIDGYYPQAAPDGTLYVMVACGGSTYLARSTDEAATFPIMHNAGGRPVVLPLPPTAPGQVGSPDLRVDPTGTMYIAWEAGPKLLLIASGDRGRSWSAPVDLTAPGVSAGQWAMAQRDGAVAVAYLGHTAGQATQDAYLTETRNPAAMVHGGRPLFYSAKLNQRPIYYGSSIQGSGYITLPLGPGAVPASVREPDARQRLHRRHHRSGRFGVGELRPGLRTDRRRDRLSVPVGSDARLRRAIGVGGRHGPGTGGAASCSTRLGGFRSGGSAAAGDGVEPGRRRMGADRGRRRPGRSRGTPPRGAAALS